MGSNLGRHGYTARWFSQTVCLQPIFRRSTGHVWGTDLNSSEENLRRTAAYSPSE